MDLEALIERAEQFPEDGKLIANLLIRAAHADAQTLPEEVQERLYNVYAYVFATNASGSFSAIQTALQRALTQPPVIEYFQRRMEASTDFFEMLNNNPAAPVLLALLCTHDDPEIAERAAMALGYSGSTLAHGMLQRWLDEGSNKKLVRAAQIALPYFSARND
jgi:hypothetical protein